MAMHDIRFIREHPEEFDRALGRRNLNEQDQIRFSSKNLLSIDERRRAIIRVHETVLARRNAASKEIGQAKAKKDETTALSLMAEVAELKMSILRTEQEQKAAEKELNNLLAEIPNLPLDEVPDGKDEKGNVEHHHFGAKRDYAYTPKQHFGLGEALGQMDFETASKLSGARFVVLKKGVARLERAIGQFFLDVHTSEPHNYIEVAPPLLVRDAAMFGTAQLPKFVQDQFMGSDISEIEGLQAAAVAILNEWSRLGDGLADDADKIAKLNRLSHTLHKLNLDDRVIAKVLLRAIEILGLGERVFWELEFEQLRKDRLWLIPTAEVPLTNLVRESILDEAQLPLRYAACTPCFRAEAGAAGKDTRGMIRQHQFTKVELVSITTPEQSKDEHGRMLACAEEVLKKLELHYRVMTLCTGDMGFASQKTYDIEVWLPGQNMYREISSCSICGEFQARRMNARYRTKEGRQVRHLHTLNGSGVAVGRALVAVLENYQNADGSVTVPEALRVYMGGIETITKA
jgi:seryl-tRNA synthetase